MSDDIDQFRIEWDEEEGEEDLGMSRFVERKKLRDHPNYFGVSLVKVSQGYFVDDWSA